MSASKKEASNADAPRTGSNLQALIDAIDNGTLPSSRITQVLSNRKAAFGLTRAQKHDIPTAVLSLKTWLGKNPDKTRQDYDETLAHAVLAGGQGRSQDVIADLQAGRTPHIDEAHKPHLIVLAGFMHIVSPTFLSVLGSQVPCINLHPALPGQFDGIEAIERAYDAFQRGELRDNTTGVMVHEVIAQVDRGEPIIVEEVPIRQQDSLDDVKTRIHDVEHRIIVDAARTVLERAGPL